MPGQPIGTCISIGMVNTGLYWGYRRCGIWGHGPGDVLFASLKPDPDPDSVDVPDELVEALAEHPEAQERFDAWTPGKKRSLASYITQAKRSETRIKRAFEMAYKMETYTLYGDKKPTD